MRTPRRLTAAAVLLATALGGTLSFGTAAAAPERGDEEGAVSRAADQYGMSAAELRTGLQNDPTLRVTGAGLYYVDPGPDDVEPVRATSQGFPLEDTFELHSKPDSQRTIYLDFDGHDVSNTWWNQAPTNLPNGTHPAWSLDDNAADFNSTERTTIQSVFQRVAEDYAPFNVDVTTQDPGDAAIIRSGPGDQEFGTRALITPSESAVNTICGGACGGVAFLDVFDQDNLGSLAQPAWVFPQKLGPNDPKAIADATTHEVGHNFSLMHDGTSSFAYYSGHGAWGPLMGAPYSFPITQFAMSDYPDAKLGGPGGDPDGFQPNPDDIATIAGNGTPLRADEAGGTIGSATAVPAGSAYIHNRTDVDYFHLGTCSGNVAVSANNAEVSPNLDIELQLLNSSNTAIDTDDPGSGFVNFDLASGMDAAVSGSSLPSGQYYVRVDGIGRGTATNGYTDYGSVGTYTLQVSGCVGGPVVTAPSAPQNLTGSFQGGGKVQLTWSAPANNGGGAITGYNIYEDGALLFDVGPSATGAGIINTPAGVHDYGVAAVNSAGEGAQAHVSVDATDQPAQAKPGKPQIGKATPGKRGGKLTAKVRWGPPSTAADPAINGYRVIVYRQKSNGKYVKTSTSPVFGPAARSAKFTTNRRGKYKFAVKARNALGFGALSAKSNAVRPR